MAMVSDGTATWYSDPELIVVALPTELLVSESCAVFLFVVAVPDIAVFADADVNDIGVRVNVVSFDIICTSFR